MIKQISNQENGENLQQVGKNLAPEITGDTREEITELLGELQEVKGTPYLRHIYFGTL